MSVLIDDELISSLIATGSVDVLIGLPTRREANGVDALVHAIVGALVGPFVRERALIMSIDTGSGDGNAQAIVERTRAALRVAGDQALRSTHATVVSLPALSGQNGLLRLLFTVADLLPARAVFLIEPTSSGFDRDGVARWLGAVLRDGDDYVKPVLPRGPLGGPIVTQLVRPLLASAYGRDLLEPLDGQLACSGAFARSALAAGFWSSPLADFGIDAFLSAWALGRAHRVGQVAASGPWLRDFDRATSVSGVFVPVVAATLESLSRDAPGWFRSRDISELPKIGRLPHDPAPEPLFDLAALSGAFRLGVDALSPFLSPLLGDVLFGELERKAASGAPKLDARLWAEVVFAFVRAALEDRAPVTRLAQMLEPLYLGRLASCVESARTPALAVDPGPLSGFFLEQKAGLARTVPSEKER